MDQDIDIAAWIRRQLARNQWTAADLARRLRMSPGRISEWLSGKRTPSPASCLRLADAFYADADDVLALAGHRVSVAPLPADDARARIIALVKRVRMTPQQANGLEAMLTAWLEMEPRPDTDGIPDER